MGNICDCLDPQSMHKASKYGCRNPECGCAKYVFDADATRKAFTEPDAADVLAKVLPVEPVADDGVPDDELARDLEELEASDPAVREAAQRLDEVTSEILDGESTSAALARVKQERDEALIEARNAEGLRLATVDRLTVSERMLANAIEERDRFVSAADKLSDSWLDVKAQLADSAAANGLLVEALHDAEDGVKRLQKVNADLQRVLAEARTEVDNLRLTRDTAESALAQACAQLVEARDDITLLENTDPLPPVRTANVLDVTTTWLCQTVTGCGDHYSDPRDDNRCVCGKRLIAITTTTAITVTH